MGQAAYTFHHLKTDDGLSNSNVKSLLKDSHGFLWIGTESGLNRYDGYGFKVYAVKSGLPATVINDDISFLQEDGLGNMWVVAGGSYIIYKRDKDRFISNVKQYLKTLGINAGKKYYIHTDRKKNLWVLSGSNIFFYDVAAKKLSNYNSIVPLDAIYTGKVTDNGTDLYLKPDLGSVLKISTTGRQSLIQLPAFICNETRNRDNRIYADGTGGLWLYATKTDQVYYSNKTESAWEKIVLRSKVNTQSNSILSITDDSNGHVWIGTDHKGVFLFDSRLKSVSNIVHDPNVNTSIASNNVGSLYADNTGVVWMGHSKKGISFYHDSFHSIVNVEHAGCKDISTIFEDHSGNIWFGTDGYGLYKKGEAFGSEIQKIPVPNNAIVSLTGDSKGRIWAGTYSNGLFCVDNGTVKHYTKEDSALASNDIWGVKEDRYGTLWIATLGSGIQLLPAGKTAFEPLSLKAHGLDYTLDFYYDGGDKLYAGTTLGLGIIDIVTHKQTFLTGNRKGTQRFKQQLVSTVFADSKGNVWLGHSKGLTLWDTKNDALHYFSKHNGLSDNIVRGITEDNHNNLWIATSNGISVLNTETDKDGSINLSSRSFSTKDGLNDNYFNNHAVLKLHTGDILFGTTEGYTVVNPNKMADKSQPLAKVRFTGLSLGSTLIDVDSVYNGRKILENAIENESNIKLRYNDKIIALQFTTGDLINADKVKYAYKLEGFSNQWLPVQDNKVVFSSLSPGSYKLLVKASNSDGVWNSEAAVLNIEVTPPFYFSVWAIVVYVLLLFGGIAYFIKRSKNKQIARLQLQKLQLEREQEINLNEMKLRFFTNISHDLRTPLTLITAPLQTLLTEDLTVGVRRKLEIINKNAEQLMSLINSLLDFRKLDAGAEKLHSRQGDFIHFVTDKITPFYAYAAERKINFSFENDMSGLLINFDPAKMERILLNLLSNAFKYTPDGGSIILKITVHEGNVHLSVLDTGQGISNDDKKNIFERFYQAPQKMESTGSGIGLHITAEYVAMHGGTIMVTDNHPQGSVFTVILPVDTAIETDYLFQDEVQDVEIPAKAHTETFGIPVLLFVDDNADFCEFMSATLSSEFTVLIANNGREALAILEQKDVNIVVSDVMMPVMSGTELCKRIKTNIQWSHIPVLLLTARTAEEYEIEGLTLGADDYLTKPFNVDILKLRIRKFLDWTEKSHRSFGQKLDVTPSEITITPLDEQLIEKAIKTVEDNISDPDFSVESLGAAVGLSRSHLYKKLMSITGKGPAEFIRTVRLKRAKQLLEKSQMQVAEIAYAVGFNSPKRFTANFKNEFGMSPSEYLRNIKSPDAT